MKSFLYKILIRCTRNQVLVTNGKCTKTLQNSQILHTLVDSGSLSLIGLFFVIEGGENINRSQKVQC